MIENHEIFEVSLNDIVPNRFQPREKFDQEALNDLAESIKRYGLIQPLVVRRLGSKYEIIAGERRYKASVIAGLTKVPVVLKDLGDEESAEVALVENIQRQNLTPIEEARSYNKLLNMGETTQEELAKKLGVAQPTVANKIRLLNLSEEVQAALLNRKISERHARSLLRLGSKEEQNDMLNKVIEQRMTVRQLDDEIAKKLGIVPEYTSDDSEEGEEKVKSYDEAPIMTSEPVQSEQSLVMDNIVPSMTSEIVPNQNIEQPFINNNLDFTNNVEEKASEEIPNISNNILPNNQNILENNNINDENSFGLNEVNVDQIKAEAQDINQNITKPDFDMLLKTDGNEEPVLDTPAPKFDPIQSISNEEVPPVEPLNNNFISPIGNIETINPSFPGPQTNVESLIREYKEEKGLPVENMAEPVLPETVSESTGAQTFVTGDLRTAINTIRKSVETVEKYGFVVDSEEFDFEDMYQIIIKIDKKKE